MFYIGGIDDDLRTDIHNALTERGLTSHMNDTKWYKLCKAVVEEMPFVPGYQEKYVLSKEPQPYLGNWAQIPECALGLHIEWIKVYPREFIHRGHLIAPQVEDHSDQFRDILIRLNIPFAEEDDLFVIYGHSSGVELPRHSKTSA